MTRQRMRRATLESETAPARSATFASLRRSRYIVLTSFRKSGEAVGTPVWFVGIAGKLYVYTGGKSGKAKRIRNNPRVTVAASTMTGKPKGPAIEGRARILTAQEGAAASRELTRKYWFLRPLNDAVNSTLGLIRGKRGPANIVYLEIAPAAD